MKLYYRKYARDGDAEPLCGNLILLHGLLGSSDNWHTIASRLSSRFRVYVPDLRNHGRSPQTPDFDYSLMADDLLEFIDDNGISRPSICGHSMGGKVAMELALSHPSSIGRLIVEDMVPGRTTPRYRKYVEVLRGLGVKAMTSRRQAEEQISREIPDRLLALFLLKNLYRDEAGSFSWRVNLESLSANYDNVWRALAGGRESAVSTLFIKGGNSEVVSESAFAEARRYFPHAELMSISGAGHWVHSEFPEPFFDAVVDFLCG